GAAGIPLNGSTSLTFTISNPNPSAALSGIAFTDNLPAGLVVAGTPNLTNSCGGTATATAGAASISLSGGMLAASGGCTMTVSVQGTSAGIKNNSVQVTSTEGGVGNTSNASITVVAPPVIIKFFGVASVPLGGSTSLTFLIQNNNSTTVLHGVAFTDSLPAGLHVSSPNGVTGSCGGGTITASAGSGTVSLSGGTIGTSSSCTFTINVTGVAAGQQNNTTGQVTSTEGGTGGTASASLVVEAPPSIAMAFSPSTISTGATTSLTFTITNPAANANQLTGVGFSDSLPVGLTVATPNGLTGSCGGGTITATAGTSAISLSGATLPTGSNCTFSVNVTAGGTPAHYTNTTTVTSTNGGTGNTASADLFAGTPVVQQSFGAASIALGRTTSLTFTVQNPNTTGSLNGVGFIDTLPSGLSVATPTVVTGSCDSGTVTADAGSATVGLSSATLAAGTSCSFSVNVTGVAAGTQTNTVGATASNSVPGPTSSASLDVIGPPSLVIAFGAPSVPVGGSTSLQFTVTNPATNTVSLTGVGVSDNLPSGLAISSPNGLSGTCGGGTIVAAAGTSTISLSGATLPTGSSCTFSVNVTPTSAGVKSNTTDALTSTNGGAGNAASATLAVLAPPGVTITTPADGARYARGQVVSAGYSCADDPNAPGVASCAGPVASGARVDTRTAGVHTFTVTATSKDGLTAAKSAHYTVTAPTVLPHSRIIGLGGTIAAGKLKRFQGTSVGGTSPVASVAIALDRIGGGATVARTKQKPRCWALAANGSIVSVKPIARRCPALRFLRASGKTRWTFRLKRPLPPGRYVLTSRATDTAGRMERPFSADAGDRVGFRVR
ncbi:MAG TPA: hypothetical protein VGH24_11145, partial [Solirubrobacteraceae bacterium]